MSWQLSLLGINKTLMTCVLMLCVFFVLLENSFAESSLLESTEITLTPNELAFLEDNPVITLGTDASWQPYVIVNPDGSISGYDADILNRINQLTGANFRLVAGTWADMQTKAKAYEIDGLSTGAAIPTRTSYLTFTDSYLTLQKSVFVTTGNPLSIKTPQDLEGKTLAIQKGNLADIASAEQFKNAKILYVNSTKEMFSSLSTGAADATFGNGATLYIANKLGMPYLQAAFHLPQPLDLVFGIRKDWPEAVSILNKGLALLSTHEKLRTQMHWFSVQYPTADKKQNKKMTLSADERQIIHNTTPLRLCVGPDWLPFSVISTKGEFQGVIADIITLISERLGTKLTLLPTATWSESVNLIQRKECDFIAALTPTKEREEFLAFSQPVFTSPVVLATQFDQFFISDLSSIKDKSVAIIKNSLASTLVKNQYPQLTIIEVDSIQIGLEQLNQKKVFGYIGSLDAITYQVNKKNHINIKISSTLPLTYDLAIGVRKDWPEWIPLFNKAIQDIPSQQKQQIRNRWIAIQYDKPIDYRLIATIIVILAAFIFLIIYRYRVIATYNTKLQNLNQELEKQARTDQLTQLPNRYLLDKEILKVIAAAQRYQEPFSVVLFDIDYFKKINDNYGHQTGDDVLIKVSQEMNRLIRKSDTLGRWGGEEFLLICPKTSLDGATMLANKIRLHIEEQRIIPEKTITISGGVAEYNMQENYHSLFKRLDNALYIAKDTGRNAISFSEATPIRK